MLQEKKILAGATPHFSLSNAADNIHGLMFNPQETASALVITDEAT
jgi:hypothetical protein